MCDYIFPQVGVQQGWQCPVCGRVYAPSITMCLWCCGNVGRTNDVVTNPIVDWERKITVTCSKNLETYLEGKE